MTSTLPVGATINGLTITEVRSFLRDHGAIRDLDAEGLIDLATLDLRDEQTFHMLAVLTAEGHLEPRSYSDLEDQVLRLTDSGAALQVPTIEPPAVCQAIGRIERDARAQLHR